MQARSGRRDDVVAEELELASLGLVHDLRSPLSAAAGAFQILETLLGQAQPETKIFRDAVRQGLRNASDVLAGWHRLLATANTPGRMEIVDVRSLITQLITELGMEDTETTGNLVVGHLPTVIAQRDKVRVALRSLLDNARRYRRNTTPLRLTIGSRRCRRHHCIFVRDNGRGIPPAYQPTIFEPFRRVPGSPGPGLGLGLHLVKRVVEHHGGRVWLRSRVGSGTTVYLTLRAAGRSPVLERGPS